MLFAVEYILSWDDRDMRISGQTSGKDHVCGAKGNLFVSTIC